MYERKGGSQCGFDLAFCSRVGGSIGRDLPAAEKAGATEGRLRSREPVPDGVVRMPVTCRVLVSQRWREQLGVGRARRLDPVLRPVVVGQSLARGRVELPENGTTGGDRQRAGERARVVGDERGSDLGAKRPTEAVLDLRESGVEVRSRRGRLVPASLIRLRRHELPGPDERILLLTVAVRAEQRGSGREGDAAESVGSEPGYAHISPFAVRCHRE